MCLDPLGRMQLLVTEAIDMLAEAQEEHAAHDPGVVEAVRARLREIEARIREVQAGSSRKKAWRVTREVIREVIFIAIELLLRASTTSCNCSPFVFLTSYASRYDTSSIASREWPLTGQARQTRRRDTLIPVTHRTRHARAHALGASPSRRAVERAVRRTPRVGVGGRHVRPKLAGRDGEAHRSRPHATADRRSREATEISIRGHLVWTESQSLTFRRSSTSAPLT